MKVLDSRENNSVIYFVGVKVLYSVPGFREYSGAKMLSPKYRNGKRENLTRVVLESLRIKHIQKELPQKPW